jgi:hypothetical protein
MVDPAQVKAAKKACITGDLRKGIDVLGDLYIESGDITFVFNQGRCYQQNHRWEEAIDRFEEYLRKSPELSPAVRAEVDGYVADCKSHLQSSPRPQPSAPVPAPLSSSSGERDGSASRATSATVASELAPGARTGAGLRVAGIATGAVGLAALATGVVLDLKTHAIVNDVYRNGYDAGKLSSRDTYQTWGWVCFGVGAAGLVAGTTLYLIGTSAGRSDSAGSSVALVPVIGPTGAMIMLQGGIQ